jgi:hypothetical protein
LGKFWRVLHKKMLVYFMDIWSFYSHLKYLWTFGIFCVILVFFSRFGTSNQKKSDHPVYLKFL